MGLPRCFSGKEFTCQCRSCGFNSWVGKIPWMRKRQPSPVFLPGKSHGQRNMVGYSPWSSRVRHNWAGVQKFHDKFSYFPSPRRSEVFLCYIFPHSTAQYSSLCNLSLGMGFCYPQCWILNGVMQRWIK